MKITKRQLRRIIKEAQWGNFTGGAAPLDEPSRDPGPVPKDQLRKMSDIFINDMGMSPDEVLKMPEFAEQGITDLRQLKEGKMKITKRQLRRIIKEERQKLIKEQFGASNKEAMSPLVQFAQAYSGLGDAIQSQLIDLVNAHIESRTEDLMDAMSRGALDVSFERLQRPLSALARDGSDNAMDMMDALEAAAEIFAQGDAEVDADARAAGDR